jgi:hypothetical protein
MLVLYLVVCIGICVGVVLLSPYVNVQVLIPYVGNCGGPHQKSRCQYVLQIYDYHIVLHCMSACFVFGDSFYHTIGFPFAASFGVSGLP